ncbi:1-acyl-sn-glycerol-3-phosphate acyltransferase [Gordonia alkaliphila]|uniref:lysophospholipid acyltransferase family protein n=1 Tax=Gordonia alkaliphila TaxID=1053547 RepID=UPI001FF250F3|nr:lysophospholipid acyltransferase family protein [Gordonia alkaliphila]MCK0438035.1 1-acyl-sn-glycerol-3-phosphate acyltransferase [Gordonia alkaliphila]
MAAAPVAQAAQTTDPWVPVSGCGPQCVPPERDRVGAVRVAGRVLALVLAGLILLPVGLLTAALPRRVRSGYWRRAARWCLRAVGLRLTVTDLRPRGARTVRGALVVANHISFLDVFAVAAVAPARFVAKREVLAMGALTPLLRCFGVLPHRRGLLRELRSDVRRVARILDRGRPVVVFPEGTTRCGIAAGAFRSAFFQSAIDAGVPVLPIALRYHRAGTTAVAPGYLGEDSVVDTLRRVLSARGLVVAVTVHPLQLPAGDRRALATRCGDLIRPERAPRAWAVPLRRSDLVVGIGPGRPPAAILDGDHVRVSRQRRLHRAGAPSTRGDERCLESTG